MNVRRINYTLYSKSCYVRTIESVLSFETEFSLMNTA
nr:MAG TPA: hypothetical protein [Caudoviricetes sp.]